MCNSRLIALLAACVTVLTLKTAHAQDDVADVPSQDLRAAGDEHMRYFLIGPSDSQRPPAEGFKLLIVMPGGPGNEEFLPFVKRIYKNALPRGYLVAEPVAVKWTPSQQIVWPTKSSKVAQMKFSTEGFVDAVIKDVRAKHNIDDKRIFTLSWSSSGPAAYAIALRDKTSVTGSFIAMSVFYPGGLQLDAAKAGVFYLYQSPDDTTCKFSFAEKARDALQQHDAAVQLAKYDGGHGWHGDVFGDIRRGVTWLEKKAGKPQGNSATKPSKRSAKSEPRPSGRGPARERSGSGAHDNLIENGGFEHGTDGWIILNNSGRAKVEIDKTVKSRGTQSLRIVKEGGVPMDVIRRDITSLPPGTNVTVSAMVKTSKVKNAFVKFFIYDEAGESLEEDVDIAHVSGTGDWKKISKTFDVPDKAKSAAVMIVMVLDGTLWIDEVRIDK